VFGAKGSKSPYKRTYGTVKNFETSTLLQRRETQNRHVLTEEMLDGDGTSEDASLKNLCAPRLFNASVNCLS